MAKEAYQHSHSSGMNSRPPLFLFASYDGPMIFPMIFFPRIFFLSFFLPPMIFVFASFDGPFLLCGVLRGMCLGYGQVSFACFQVSFNGVRSLWPL